jgi:hypothetical protein
MEDFPIWLKGIIYIVIGGSLLHAISSAVYYSF